MVGAYDWCVAQKGLSFKNWYDWVLTTPASPPYVSGRKLHHTIGGCISILELSSSRKNFLGKNPGYRCCVMAGWTIYSVWTIRIPVRAIPKESDRFGSGVSIACV